MSVNGGCHLAQSSLLLCWHTFSLKLKICGVLDSSLCPVAYRSNTFTTQSVKSVLLSQDIFFDDVAVVRKLHSPNILTRYILGHVVAGFPHLD